MKIFLYLFVTVIIQYLGYYFLFSYPKTEQVVIDRNARPLELEDFIGLYKAKLHLETQWSSGIYTREMMKEVNCPGFHWSAAEVNSDALKCLPELLNCYYDGKLTHTHNPYIETEVGKQRVVFRLIRYGQGYTLEAKDRNSVGIKIQKLNSPEFFEFDLLNNCHQEVLPAGEYVHEVGYNPNAQKNYLIWNNENPITVDKFQVTKREIAKWKGDAIPKFDWFKTASGITLEEMQKYCEDRGKKLLTARVLDAMTFFRNPMNSEQLLEPSDFPWGNKRNEFFLRPDSKSKNDVDVVKLKIPTGFCDKSYIKECLKKDRYQHFSTDSVSWMGANQLSGYYMEAIENNARSYFNVRASSFYFDRYSKWHLAGNRLHWDGKGFRPKNFEAISSITGDELEPIHADKVRVGFRCFQE